MDAVQEHLRRLDRGQVDALLAGDREVLVPLVWPSEPAAWSGGLPDHGARPTETYGVSWSVAEGVSQTVLFAALAGMLGRLAGAGPLVLVLDDAQWADQSSVAFVHYVTRPASGPPILVVLGRRPEEGPAYRPDGTIQLGPLDLAAATEIVGPEKSAELHARTGGNPLFLVELSRSEAQGLPESVRTAVSGRVDRAGPAAPTIRAAAVLGPDVDLDLLAAVLRRPATALLDDLEEGARRHLLVERRSGFGFPHQLVREALVASASTNRRTLLHRESARWLATRPGAGPLDIAYHAKRGGDAQLAAQALADAAQIAADRLDPETANRLLDEAVAADEGARLADDQELRASCLALSGRVLHGTGDMHSADERLAEASEIATGTSRPITDVWRAWLLVHRGDAAGALAAVPHQAHVERSHIPLVAPNRHVAAGYAEAMLGHPAAALASWNRLTAPPSVSRPTAASGEP